MLVILKRLGVAISSLLMLSVDPDGVFAQIDDAEFEILAREDGRVFVYHDQAIPLSHGFNVYRSINGGEWSLLTESPVFPVQNGFQLQQKLGELFVSLQEDTRRQDPQAVYLRLRAPTTEALLMNMSIPEVAKAMGRVYVDNDPPSVGSRVAYRFEIVDDLERPTGTSFEGGTRLETIIPPPPTNMSLDHDGRRVVLKWSYPAFDTPGTETAIRFRAAYRETGSARIREVTDNILLRTTTQTDYRYTFNVPELGREYEFWVEAVDYSGQSSEKSEVLRVRIEDNVPPPIMSGIRARITDDYEVEVTWPVSTARDLAGYHVYRSEGGHDEAFIKLNDELLAPLQTAYLDQDTQPDAEYRYVLTAVDRSGNESPKSNPAHIRIIDYTYPEPVAELSAAFDEENGTVNLEWVPGEEYANLRTYRVMRRQVHPDPGGYAFSQVNETQLKEPRVTDRGLAGEGFREGLTFEYGVAVVNNSGNASDTVFTRFQIPVITPPDPPRMVQSRMGQSQRVHLNWAASPSRDVTHYAVYRLDIEADSTKHLNTRQRGSRTLRDDDIQLDRTYVYTVTAIDSAGNESAPAFADTLLTRRSHPPARVRNVQAVFGEEGVRLTWQRSGDDQIRGFRIYRSDIATGRFTPVGQTGADVHHFTDSNGTSGQWYKVFPYDASGREARSATATQAVTRSANR